MNTAAKIFVVVLVLALLPMVSVPAGWAEEGTFKVVFLMADSPQDNGWNFAHFRGIQQLKSLGEVIEDTPNRFVVRLEDGRLLEVLIIEKIGYAIADIDRFAEKAVVDGANMLFMTWWDSKDTAVMISEAHPDVLVEHCSGYPVIQSNGRNRSTYFIRQELGDYVAGVAVARMGYHSGGIIATQMIPEPVRAVNGFLLGMQSVWPDATVRVVWIFSWLDQAKEAAAATGLMEEGFTVIRQLADTPYSSQTACQEPGHIAVGYGSDVDAFAPCAVITNTWEWGSIYVDRVKKALDGTWTPQDAWYGFNEGTIGIVGKAAPYVQDVIQKIKDGFNPFNNFTCRAQLPDGSIQEVKVDRPMTDAELLSMQCMAVGYEGQLPAVQEPIVIGTTE